MTDHPAEPARILIVRLSALGDLVFCTSLLDGLHRRFPQARIDWLAQSGFAGLLCEDPRLNELIAIPKDTLSAPAALWRLRRGLRARRYDWVIDAQGLAKSRVLAWLAGGRRRIGFRSKEPLGFVMHEIVGKGGDDADIGSEYRYLAGYLTGQPASPPSLPVTAQAAVRVSVAMNEQGLSPGFVALCPFTTRPQKHWFESYWTELAQLLDQEGYHCAIFGGPADADHAQALCDSMPPGTLNLAGRTAIKDLAAWLKQATCVIGVDTGLTHIGIAIERPVVALFGSTCPYTRGGLAPLSVLYDALPCSPCRRHPTCDGAFTCMRQLTPQRVYAAAVALTQASNS